MWTIFAADTPAATTDRLTLIILGGFTLIGTIFTALAMRSARRLPGPSPDHWMAAVAELREDMFEVRGDVLDIKMGWATTNAEVVAMRRQFEAYIAASVEESRWDGKTDRRRKNPPPYGGPERRKET
jgi:hypothetical protein